MDLLSGYSDAGINAFNANQNMIGTNLMNNISNQQAQQQRDMAQWAAYNPFANSPGGFGGQTAHYAGLGAAYGRATGGYGGYGARNADPFSPVQSGGYPSGSVQRGPDLQAPAWQDPIKSSSPWEGAGFDAIKYLNAPGNEDLKAANVNPWQHALQHGFSENRQGLGWNPETYLKQNQDVRDAGVNPWQHAQEHGFAEGRTGLEGLEQVSRDQLARAMSAQQPKNPYAGMILGPGGNPSYFNPGTYAGDRGNYGIPFNGRPMAGDIGSQGNRNMPNLGYNPGMQNWFAPQQGPNAYAPLGGAMQFPGSGTPSQNMPMYDSGDTLTPMDRLGTPFRGWEGSGA